MSEKELEVLVETPMESLMRRRNERRNALRSGGSYGMEITPSGRTPTGTPLLTPKTSSDKHSLADLFDKKIEGTVGDKLGNVSEKHGKRAIGSFFDYLAKTRLGKRFGKKTLDGASKSLSEASSPYIKNITKHAYNEGKSYLTKKALKELGSLGAKVGAGALTSYLAKQNFGASGATPGVQKYANGGRVCVSRKERNKFEGSSPSSKVEQFRNCFK